MFFGDRKNKLWTHAIALWLQLYQTIENANSSRVTEIIFCLGMGGKKGGITERHEKIQEDDKFVH